MNKGCLIGAIVILVLLTAGLGYYFMTQGEGGPEKFETTKAEVKDVIIKAVATGSIKPRLEVNIKPQVSGVVDRLYVEAGQMVKKGQKLARIKLIPSEVNVNSAQSNVDLARIRVQEGRRELQRQKEVYGQQLDVKEAKRNLDIVIEEATRQQQLFEDGIISKQENQRSKLDLDLRQNAYDNALLQSKNNLSQFEAQLEIRIQEFNAATNNLQLLKEGVTKNSKQVSNIVMSTVAGMILDVPVEEGSSVIERNNFNEGTSIAVIADMSNIIFEGMVDESDVGKLQEGMELLMTVGALPDDEFEAILEFISPKGEIMEGTVKFEIKAAIKPYAESVFLRAGYSANADIILDRSSNVITIYERDVVFKDDTTYVKKVTGDRETEEIKVSLGLSDGLIVEVKGGLDTMTQIQVILDPNAED